MKLIIYLLNYIKSNLLKNALYLIFVSILGSGSGFVFWILAARLYEVNEVGIGGVLISAVGYISFISCFGMDISMTHYLPKTKNKAKYISNAISIVIPISLIISIIYIFGINIWAKQFLNYVNNITYLLLPLIVMLSSLNYLMINGIFVGLRDARYSLINQIVIFARIGFLPLFVILGSIGIFICYGITMCLAIFVSITILLKLKLKINFSFNKNILNNLIGYSFMNCIAGVIQKVPNFLLPLLIVNNLCPSDNALFYVCWTVSGLSRAIPNKIGASMLAETSYNMNCIKSNFKKSIVFSLILTTIFLVMIFAFGKYVLMLFGENYIKSIDVLKILTLSTIPFIINEVIVFKERANQRMLIVVIIYLTITTITIGLTAIVVKNGLIWVANSWLISNTLVSIILIIKEKGYMYIEKN